MKTFTVTRDFIERVDHGSDFRMVERELRKSGIIKKQECLKAVEYWSMNGIDKMNLIIEKR